MSLAEQRARLFTDLVQLGWSTLRPGTFTEDDAAYIADMLITRGWRLPSDQECLDPNHAAAVESVRRGFADMEVQPFRCPGVSGQRKCRRCGQVLEVHGWIETPEGGRKVCPSGGARRIPEPRSGEEHG